MYKKIINLISVYILFACLNVFADNIVISTDIDYDADILTVSGSNATGNITSLYVEGPNHRLEFISELPIENGNFSISFKIMEAINGVFTIRYKTNEMSAPHTVEFYYSTPYNNSPMTKHIKEFCIEGNEYNYMLKGEDLYDFSKTFILEYNPEYIEMTDLCMQTPGTNLQTGKIVGTDINILEYDSDAGIVIFEINSNIAEKKAYNGILNIFRFKALVSGQSVISITQNQ